MRLALPSLSSISRRVMTSPSIRSTARLAVVQFDPKVSSARIALLGTPVLMALLKLGKVHDNIAEADRLTQQ